MIQLLSFSEFSTRKYINMVELSVPLSTFLKNYKQSKCLTNAFTLVRSGNTIYASKLKAFAFCLRLAVAKLSKTKHALTYIGNYGPIIFNLFHCAWCT